MKLELGPVSIWLPTTVITDLISENTHDSTSFYEETSRQAAQPGRLLNQDRHVNEQPIDGPSVSVV